MATVLEMEQIQPLVSRKTNDDLCSPSTCFMSAVSFLEQDTVGTLVASVPSLETSTTTKPVSR